MSVLIEAEILVLFDRWDVGISLYLSKKPINKLDVGQVSICIFLLRI